MTTVLAYVLACGSEEPGQRQLRHHFDGPDFALYASWIWEILCLFIMGSRWVSCMRYSLCLVLLSLAASQAVVLIALVSSRLHCRIWRQQRLAASCDTPPWAEQCWNASKGFPRSIWKLNCNPLPGQPTLLSVVHDRALHMSTWLGNALLIPKLCSAGESICDHVLQQEMLLHMSP